jgi:hypothetical protein
MMYLRKIHGSSPHHHSACEISTTTVCLNCNSSHTMQVAKMVSNWNIFFDINRNLSDARCQSSEESYGSKMSLFKCHYEFIQSFAPPITRLWIDATVHDSKQSAELHPHQRRVPHSTSILQHHDHTSSKQWHWIKMFLKYHIWEKIQSMLHSVTVHRGTEWHWQEFS